MRDDTKTKAQLIEELTALRQQGVEAESALQTEEGTKVNLALERVRNETLQMEKEADWRSVQSCFHRELCQLVEYDGLGINVIDRQNQAYSADGVNVDHRTSYDFLPASLQTAIDSQTPVYRRNRAEMEQYGDKIGPERNSVVDVPFTSGTIAVSSNTENAFSESDIQILSRFSSVMSEGYRRLEDITERKRQQARRVALYRVRGVISEMHTSGDIESVLATVHGSLRALGIPFLNCGINLEDRGSLTVTFRSHNMRMDGEWFAQTDPRETEVLTRIVKEGEVAYRRDLIAEDVYGERERISADWGEDIRSVVDIPFSHGSLAVNSTEPNAFAEHDLEALQEIAQVLDEGLQRMEDLESLEQRNRELEAEITERRRAEGALVRARNEWESTFDAIADWICLADGNGNILRSNRSGEELAGIPVTQMPGQSLCKLLHGSDGPIPGCPMQKMMETQQQQTVDLRLPESGRWLRVTAEPVEGESGEHVSGVHIVRDITEEKQTEQALRESEERFRSVYESAAVGIAIVDPAGVILGTNPACERMLGYPEDGCRGLSFEDLLRPDDTDKTKTFFTEMVEGRRDHYRMEKRYRRRDGSLVWADVSVSAVRGSGGEFQYCVGLAHDISERKRAEEALEQGRRIQDSEAAVRIRLAEMDQQQDLGNVVEELGRSLRKVGIEHDSCAVQMVNAAGTAFVSVGVSPPERRFVDEQALSSPGAKASAERYPWVIEVWRTGRPRYDRCTPENAHMTPGMSLVDVPFSHGTLAVNRQEPNAFCEADIEILQRLATVLSEGMGHVLGIGERKRLEQEIIHLERMRASGELAAGVSHNLNNMLTAVLGPAQLLLRRSDDPGIRREADTILTAGRRARDLVSRLNQAVRAERADHLVPVSLNEQVLEVVEMARPRWKDEPESRGISVDVVTQLRGVPDIRGIVAELDDTILNLLLNAVQAMPDGGTITIATQVVKDGVQLTVSDSGIGMDEETCRRVFEPFFTTRMDIGSGLGLSTVHGSVSRWGGTIGVDSTPGQGTTFTLCFPVWSESVPRAETPTAAVAMARSGRLLIVDDDEDVCALLDRLLSDDHTIQVVRDGKEALEQFVPGQHDVALIDLGMPGMAGDRVAAEMKAADPCLVTVLITGWVLAEADHRKSGFDFQLDKPFDDLDAMESVVSQAIELHHTRVRSGSRQG